MSLPIFTKHTLEITKINQIPIKYLFSAGKIIEFFARTDHKINLFKDYLMLINYLLKNLQIILIFGHCVFSKKLGTGIS